LEEFRPTWNYEVDDLFVSVISPANHAAVCSSDGVGQPQQIAVNITGGQPPYAIWGGALGNGRYTGDVTVIEKPGLSYINVVFLCDIYIDQYFEAVDSAGRRSNGYYIIDFFSPKGIVQATQFAATQTAQETAQAEAAFDIVSLDNVRNHAVIVFISDENIANATYNLRINYQEVELEPVLFLNTDKTYSVGFKYDFPCGVSELEFRFTRLAEGHFEVREKIFTVNTNCGAVTLTPSPTP
jgi:hypothetical protein